MFIIYRIYCLLLLCHTEMCHINLILRSVNDVQNKIDETNQGGTNKTLCWRGRTFYLEMIYTLKNVNMENHRILLWVGHYVSMISMGKCHECEVGTMPLPHWGWRKIGITSQMTLSDAFSLVKMYGFCLRFHWFFFIRVQSRIFQLWFQ